MQSEQENYQFILDPNQTPRGGGNAFLQDPKNRLIALVGFVGGVLILVILVLALIFSSGGSSQDDLVSIAAYQTELARLADKGQSEGESQSMRIQSANLYSIMSSDLRDTEAYLATNAKELTPEQGALEYDSDRDEELETAAQRNRYDTELAAMYEELISEYKEALSDALTATSGEKKKELLETAAANILLFEGPSAESSQAQE